MGVMEPAKYNIEDGFIFPTGTFLIQDGRFIPLTKDDIKQMEIETIKAQPYY